jgi:SAM-dependent methyltransferase
MLAIARERQAQRDAPSNIRWFDTSAEAHRFDGLYACVVAAESLHWMDWAVVLPAIGRCLTPRGHLAIVTVRQLIDLPWQPQLIELIGRYSTNGVYRPYDIAHELTVRGLFDVAGQQTVIGAPFAQSADDYVESFHSRNGFSRERMGAAADAFDRELHELVRAHAPTGVVEAKVTSTVFWGKPRA